MKGKLSLMILFISVVICWRCNNTSDSSKEEPATDQPQPVKNLPVYLIDSVEHLFGNENWRMIDGTDTSYILFSRQSNPYIRVYRYKMSQGDSANSVTSAITFRNDSVVWTQPGQELILQKASGKEIDWKDNSLTNTAIFSFRQTGKDKIVFQRGPQTVYMIKTITLSDFLVRSRYDFFHGTHYAFDTIKFHGPKKSIDKAVIKN